MRILRVIVFLVLSELVVAAQTALSVPPVNSDAARPSEQPILVSPEPSAMAQHDSEAAVQNSGAMASGEPVSML